MEKWGEQETATSCRLNELELAYNQLDQPFIKVTSSMHDTAKAAEVFLSNPSNALDVCYQTASELYTNLQQSSKDQTGNSVVMTKAFVKTLKVQQIAFTECFTQIRMAEECLVHVDTFSPQLLLLKQDIDQFHDLMLSMQRQRQNDVWTLLERAVIMPHFLKKLPQAYRRLKLMLDLTVSSDVFLFKTNQLGALFMFVEIIKVDKLFYTTFKFYDEDKFSTNISSLYLRFIEIFRD